MSSKQGQKPGREPPITPQLAACQDSSDLPTTLPTGNACWPSPAKGSDGIVSIAIEDKVSEPFDSPVDKRSSSDGCPARAFPDDPTLQCDDFAFFYGLPRLIGQRHTGNEYQLLCNRSQ
jgi:hypothetical protein